MMERVDCVSGSVGPLKMPLNRFGHELFCVLDRIFERKPGSKPGRYRSGISASGPVSGDIADKRRGELLDSSVMKKQVNRGVSGEMTSFQQNRCAVLFAKRARGTLHCLSIVNLLAQ